MNNGDSPNAPYYYRVRAYKCTPKQYSSFVNSSSFPIYTACDDPAAPTVDNPTAITLDITLNAESPVANPAITTYSIYCVTTGTYVTATGALGAEVYQTKAVWGTITVTGLTCNTSYTFYAKAQNNQADVRYNVANTGTASTPIISGHYTNPEVVTNGNSYSRDNTDACKTDEVATYSCTSWNESGKEHWFQIAMTEGQVLDVQQTTASVDIDYFITSTAGGSTCYDGAYGSSRATASVGSSGNYYISCDGYNGVAGTFTVSVNTVSPPTSATALPTTICAGSDVTLTASGGGGTGSTLYWYSGSCGGAFVGSGTPLIVNPTSNTTYYAAYILNGKITSCVATANVTVNQLPAITGQPSNSSITYGDATSFSVTATDGTSYQWQEYISSWNDISNGGVYSNATTAILNLTKPPVSMNAYKYRCVVSGICTPSATSDGNATLSVTAKGLSVTANSVQYKYFGQSDPVFTYSATGFVTGEDAGVLIGSLSRVSGEAVGDYAITVGTLAGANYTIAFTSDDFEVKPAYLLNLTVFLQGSYNSGTGEMSTTLNPSQIPTVQPFNVSPWNYNGTETLPSPLSADVVDWVLVDLRSDESTLFERKAALLYKDGSVKVSFTSSSAGGNYYVVWHRNHMPVMSDSKYSLPIEGNSYSLTSLNNLYGTNPAIDLGSSVYGMIAGDVTKNGVLQYSGPGNDRGAIIQKIAQVVGSGTTINSTITGGYWFEDVNLNNEVKYNGTDNDRAFVANNLNAMTGNPQTNTIYSSVVPGAIFGSKNNGSNDGPFDIQVVESFQAFSIEVVTTEPVVNGLIDNIQFTLSWKAADTEIADMLNSYTSDFMLAAQGEPYEEDGVMHQVYISVTPVDLPQLFSEGDLVNVLSFTNITGQTILGRLWIADNEFTVNNNGMYYVSVWGTDFTGNILSLTTDIVDVPGMESVKIYPNPVNRGSVNISINLTKAQKVVVSLTDIQGKVISLREINMNEGLSINPYDVNGLKPGVYFIIILGNDLNTVEKLIIK